MSDAKSQPTAGVRVRSRARTLEELRGEYAQLVSRTTITLEGTGERAVGETLRFEVLLADGSSALRGEGREVGAQGSGPRAGVVLRFTKLDSRSKQLVDAMVALHAASSQSHSQSQPRYADTPSQGGPASVGSLRSQPWSSAAPDSSPGSQPSTREGGPP